MIREIEEKWLEKSTLFVNDHFNNIFLPSHDVTHHLRTWKNAKSIITHISELNKTVTLSTVEAILLATLFHDTGMAVTRAPEHGSFSKESYLEFIGSQGKDQPVLQKQIIRAIELHDRKDQYVYLPFNLDAPPDILTVTSIADDLDALGTIGIYRYAEIYLHRQVELKFLGIQILKNISVRFNNLIKASSLIPAQVNQAKKQYQKVINFFDQYNRQILTEKEPETTLSGHIGVINYIRKFCVEGKIRPEYFLDTLNNSSVGNFVHIYFEDLKYAINENNS
jgi:HD superfamily phosphodiesterase